MIGDTHHQSHSFFRSTHYYIYSKSSKLPPLPAMFLPNARRLQKSVCGRCKCVPYSAKYMNFFDRKLCSYFLIFTCIPRCIHVPPPYFLLFTCIPPIPPPHTCSPTIFLQRQSTFEPSRAERRNFTPKSDFEIFGYMYRSASLESNPLLFVIF